jgi:hypothetical protein
MAVQTIDTTKFAEEVANMARGREDEDTYISIIVHDFTNEIAKEIIDEVYNILGETDGE